MMRSEQPLPNILVLQADQLSASALRCYGNDCSQTPHLDALAASSAVFDNFYCNFPVCAPSRASMMTGRLASSIGVYDNAAAFGATVPTLAHYLRAAGYYTCLSGKMHFIGPDLLHGFEDRLTPEIYSSDLETMPDWSSPDVVDFASDAADALAQAGPAPRTVQMDYDEEAFIAARQKIFDHARGDDERPLFLLASFTHPHDPYICRQEFWDLYDDAAIDMPRTGRLAPADLDAHSERIYRHYNLADPAIDEAGIRRARRGYYGSLSYVDQLVGRLLQTLEETGLRDNTIVIFTSDHGDMLGERGMWFKKVFYENAARVPLMISGPGVRPSRIDGNTSLLDLLPTLLDIADPDKAITPVDELDGDSLMPLVRGEATWLDRPVVAELTCESVTEPVVMIRKGRYKYIYGEEAGPLLYDLVADPEEGSDLAARPESAEVISEFTDIVTRTWGSLSDLKDTIIASQGSRRLVASALTEGKFSSWDDLDPAGSGERYLRHGKSYNEWNYEGVASLRQATGANREGTP